LHLKVLQRFNALANRLRQHSVLDAVAHRSIAQQMLEAPKDVLLAVATVASMRMASISVASVLALGSAGN
jgi:hypothetical protein